VTTDDKVSYGMAAVGAVVIATCMVYWPGSYPDPTPDLDRCAALFQVQFRDESRDHWSGTSPTYYEKTRYYKIYGRGCRGHMEFGWVAYNKGMWNYAQNGLTSYGNWSSSHPSYTLDECLERLHVQR